LCLPAPCLETISATQPAANEDLIIAGRNKRRMSIPHELDSVILDQVRDRSAFQLKARNLSGATKPIRRGLLPADLSGVMPKVAVLENEGGLRGAPRACWPTAAVGRGGRPGVRPARGREYNVRVR